MATRALRGLVYLLGLLIAAPAASAQWRVAEPGWTYAFPRDHGNHPDFKTEWWYFTGNLRAKDGRPFGYQLTFFRQGITRWQDVIPLSRFVVRDIRFAHFAVSDPTTNRFRFFQKISRGAFGESGFDEGGRLAWIDDWSCAFDGAFSLSAAAGGASLALRLVPTKPVVFQGADGISRKGAAPGQASHYYSFTRMSTEGVLRLGGEEFEVTGESWFDHEWATNQLGENQVGWDWFSLQFDDGTELMLFQLRTREGGRDLFSSGTFVDAEGKATPIAEPAFILEPTDRWKSPQTGASYPVRWKLAVPSLELSVEIRAVMDNQELVLQPITYWEGAIRAEGTRSGRAVTAAGYLEMTGYAGPVRGMQAGR